MRARLPLWVGLFSSFLAIPTFAAPGPSSVSGIALRPNLDGKRLADQLLLASDGQRARMEPKAVELALRRHGTRRAALRADFVRQHNSSYTNELPATPIHDQKSSGRCWIFTAMNVVERDATVRIGKPVTLSRAYINARNLQATAYEMLHSGADVAGLGSVLSTEVGEGGYFQWALQVIDKYGAVPEHVMRDFADSKSSAAALKLIQTRVATAQEDLRKTGHDSPESLAIVKAAQGDIDRIVAREFTGKETLPNTFIEGGVAYTPKSYAEHLGIKSDDYVSLEDTRAARPGWRRLNGTGMHRFATYNVRDIEVMKQAVRNAIDQGKKVYIAAPVGGASAPYMVSSDSVGSALPAARGIMSLSAYDYQTLGLPAPVPDRATNQARDLYPANHAMTIVGYDLDKNGKVIKWKVENSWGPDAADHGIEHMYDDFFTSLVEVVSVPRSAISKALDDQITSEKQAASTMSWEPKP